LKQKQNFEERYGDIDLLFQDGYNEIQISTFTEAIEYISSCLEGDDPPRLAGSVADFEGRLGSDPDYSIYFLEAIFEQLRAADHERRLFERFDDIQFPRDKNEFVIDFPGKRGLVLSFIKQEMVWILRDIYLVR
jgi:hypothetical protein